ncbi:MAG TPA: hypothetical protein VNQ78_14180 [Paracoccus sp. (in: a-proteobacteria)]|uniref:COG4705 family protein n=1 Tax=Paracoccus sp. TaxID=267 RepID=UPI002C7B4D6F|nr:hypothetical protein [Paracoccus sp. (in: a-proteobacteria)]HWL57807.1 hypothetical protein [Paracoccus sp. (in: a-proteobacteria)]
MTYSVTPAARDDLYNKVPEVTACFWAIKIMATTVGETGADYLIFKLGLGLPTTSILMALALAVVLFIQMRADRYMPWIYWLAVTMISIVGTLITDSLTDTYGVALQLSTVIFIAALIATFVIWYRREHTLSIHSIDNPVREACYWLAVLFTFALGTAAGDLLAGQLGLGYLASALLFGAAILVVVGMWRTNIIGAVTAFWLAYILTRPLGASLGDLLSQPVANGGLGLGTTATSLVFLAAILGLVVYMTMAGPAETLSADR